MRIELGRTRLAVNQKKTVIPCLRSAPQLHFLQCCHRCERGRPALPPRVVGQPQYGLAPSPAIPPPQVIIIPGPTAPPPYNGAMLPPPVVGSPRASPRVWSQGALNRPARRVALSCRATWRAVTLEQIPAVQGWAPVQAACRPAVPAYALGPQYPGRRSSIGMPIRSLGPR
jgi:hypothetical protein